MYVKFAEIAVFDQKRAIAFYTTHFGCTLVSDSPYGEAGWNWVELALPGAETNLHFARRADELPSDIPALVLVDDDVAATVERLRGAGVEIVTEPRDAPWEPDKLYAEIRDSEGNRIVIGAA